MAEDANAAGGSVLVAEVLRQRHTQLLKLAKEPNKARFVQELTASKAGQFRTLAQLHHLSVGALD